MNSSTDKAWRSRGTAKPPEGGITEARRLIVSAPPSALITDPRDVRSNKFLLRGAWAWVLRKVLGEKVSSRDRRQFMLSKVTCDTACALFAEKRIAPVEWMAWRAAKGMARGTTLEDLVGLGHLQNSKIRNWFRGQVKGAFGGSVTVVTSSIDSARDEQKRQEIEQKFIAAASGGAAFPVNLPEWLKRVRDDANGRQGEDAGLRAERGIRAGAPGARHHEPRGVGESREAPRSGQADPGVVQGPARARNGRVG